jgi:hypothetical protein
MTLVAPVIALCVLGLGLRWLYRQARVGEADVIDERGELIGQAYPVIHPDVHDTTPLSAAVKLDAERVKHAPPGA